MYYRHFWHIIRENFIAQIIYLMLFDVFKNLHRLKSLDQTFIHCPIFITAIHVEFSYCFRANQASKSLNCAKDCRPKKFKLFCMS